MFFLKCIKKRRSIRYFIIFWKQFYKKTWFKKFLIQILAFILSTPAFYLYRNYDILVINFFCVVWHFFLLNLGRSFSDIRALYGIQRTKAIQKGYSKLIERYERTKIYNLLSLLCNWIDQSVLVKDLIEARAIASKVSLFSVVFMLICLGLFAYIAIKYEKELKEIYK